MPVLSTSRLYKLDPRLRRRLSNLPGVKQRLTELYLENLDKYQSFLCRPEKRDCPILDSLNETGTIVSTLTALQFKETAKLRKCFSSLISDLDTIGINKDSIIELPQTRLVDYLDVFVWGLNERLLALVENYIGLPVYYHGFSPFRGLGDGYVDHIRQWHLDVEDRRMIKLIVYLNDVDEDGGCFQYFHRDVSGRIRQDASYRSGYVSESDMLQHVPKDEWHSCIGPAETVVICDTANVFHRAKPPTARDRYSITFNYTSVQPTTICKGWNFSAESAELLSKTLSDRQKSCLPV